MIKGGGNFVFIDLFKDGPIFRDKKLLIKSLDEMKLRNFELIELVDEINFPMLLRGKRILGNAMLLYGEK